MLDSNDTGEFSVNFQQFGRPCETFPSAGFLPRKALWSSKIRRCKWWPLRGGRVYNGAMPAETTQQRGLTALRFVESLGSLLPVLRWAFALSAVPGMALVVLLVLGSALPALLIMGMLFILQLPMFLLLKLLLPPWDSHWPDTDGVGPFDRFRELPQARRDIDL
jgi:hypothetical protein